MAPKIVLILASGAMCWPLIKAVALPGYPRNVIDENRTIIITGATGNHGKTLVTQLAYRKCRLILPCRDIDKCKALRREIVMKTGSHNILCRHMDLEDIDSMNRFCDEVIEKEPHIDVLINNAAIKQLKQKELTKYGIERMYFVNFLAPYFLTLKLKDKLLESSMKTHDSRVINVIGKPKKSWIYHIDDINFEKRTYSSEKAYQQSKLALAYFTITLEKICKENMQDLYAFGSNPIFKSDSIAESFLRPIGILEQTMRLVEAYTKFPAEKVVQPVIKCALHPGLNNRLESGWLYGFLLEPWGWGKVCKNETFGKLVWNNAAELLLSISKKGDKAEIGHK